MNQRALIHRLIVRCRDYENMVIENVSKVDLLQNEVADLKEMLTSAEESAQAFEESAAWHEQLAAQRARELRQEQEEAQRAQRDHEYQDYKESEALDKLKRAQSNGDAWGASRAMRELEDIRRW